MLRTIYQKMGENQGFYKRVLNFQKEIELVEKSNCGHMT